MSIPDKTNTGRADDGQTQTAITQPPATNPLPRLAYTMRETAIILGVSYITVHRLLKRGKLRASDAIRSKVIPRSEIERFLRDSISEQSLQPWP
jgi:excisionase family DNA binding protein